MTPRPRGIDRELIANAIQVCAKASRFVCSHEYGPHIEVAGRVALRELCYPGWSGGEYEINTRWPTAALASLESGTDAAILTWLGKQSGEWTPERQGELLQGAAQVVVLRLANAMTVGLAPRFLRRHLLPVVALLGPELQALDTVLPIDRTRVDPRVVIATWPDCTTRADEQDDLELLAAALAKLPGDL